MQVLNSRIWAFATLLLVLTSCKKEVEEKTVYDNIIYQIDTTVLYNSSAEKVKQKTPTQYISILYSDLFNSNMSGKDLSELSELSVAMGDKTMANELTLSHYLQDANVDMPSDADMRADLEKFVAETYLKFYQRKPGPYEKLYLTDVIEKDAQMTVEDVYTAFILSNEYYYY